MGLLSLQTNLKSLKYSKDRPGGGSSNQPYIITDIPSGLSTLSNYDNDFILRGGILAGSRTAQDVSRLTQMFVDTKSPNGLLFTIKQNALTRLGVRTQAGGQEIYLPTSTLAQAGVSAFGLHLYKQGINPFPDFNIGGIDIDLPGNLKTYSQVVPVGSSKSPNNFTLQNRLFQLFDVKILKNPTPFINTNNITGPSNNISLLQYGGGPGSVLGIGPTNIKFADQRTVTLIKSDPLANYSLLSVTQISDLGDVNLSRNSKSFTPKIVDFRKDLQTKLPSIISASPEYTGNAAIEQRVFLGDPGKRGNISSYTNGKRRFDEKGTLIGATDRITAKILYSSRFVDKEETNDLVKFRIEAINNDDPGSSVFIHFRAFLNNFSDTYNATWNATKYVGRGEEFYTYGGFTRGISVDWTVAAQSKEELIPMYQKLNYLASNLTPDYSSNGYMRGPMMRLTIGGYLYSQPGFMTSLTYTIDETTPWEIGINDTDAGSDNSVKELPHIIKVSMNYTPIHAFVPRKQTNKYKGVTTIVGPIIDGKKADEAVSISEFGPERYIALSTGNHNNYTGDPNYTRTVKPVETQPIPTPTQQPINRDQEAIFTNNNPNIFTRSQ
jgi:hypothetical protein